MRIALRKVLRDLWRNLGRTMLVVISIAIGVLALGMTTTSNALINKHITDSRIEKHSAHARINLSIPFDDDVVDAITRLPEVESAEGWTSLPIRWRTSPQDEWQDATVIALVEFQNQKFDRIDLVAGLWPDDDAVAIEFNHQEPYGAPAIGGDVYFEINKRGVLFRLNGTVRDPAQGPPPFNPIDQAVFYVDRDGLELLTGNRNYNQLRFIIPQFSQDRVEVAIDAVEEKLSRLGITSRVSTFTADIQDPDRSQAQEFLNGLGLVLVVMAIMSLGLSVILVINVINAIISSQIPQIGIMKTIGGVRRQITMLYLAGIIIYSLLSLLIAVPIGTISGFLLSRGMLNGLNVQIPEFELVSTSLVIQIAVGLLTPLLAALWPIVKGAAISVIEAISAYGIGTGQYGGNRLDNLISRVRGMPSLVTLTLRNTFRRAGRVILTEITLIGAGAMFMMIVATGDSFNKTIDDIWSSWGFNVLVIFQDFQRSDEIVASASVHPEVEEIEMWIWMGAAGRVPGTTETSDNFDIQMRGAPRETTMFAPELVAGRRLLTEDGHAIVLNQKLASDMGLGVGDQIMIELLGGVETTWTIVGLGFDIGAGGVQNTAFVHVDILSEDLQRAGQATVAQIRTIHNSVLVEETLKEYMLDFFEEQKIDISFAIGQREQRELATALWGIIGGLLQLMSILMAVVGSVGLSGTLSINVFERRREIGVMRAVGASSLDVALIFMGEGLLLGLVSWMIAVLLSAVAARFFIDALGQALQFPFFFEYSVTGIWLWGAIVVVLSILASWFPARRATRISVNESLAYE